MSAMLSAFLSSLLPWRAEFSAPTLLLVIGYVLAQVLFCVSLRRLAMHIPGPERMCSPIGLWVLAIPVVGGLASFGVLRHIREAAKAATDVHHLQPAPMIPRSWELLYGASRLLILVPGLLVPAILIESVAGWGFLLKLGEVARSLRTPDVAVR